MIENEDRISRSSPSPPSAASFRSAAVLGWCRHMNASISTTPRDRQCAAIAAASAPSIDSGFSQRTCFPASAAAKVHGLCSSFGRGM